MSTTIMALLKLGNNSLKKATMLLANLKLLLFLGGALAAKQEEDKYYQISSYNASHNQAMMDCHTKFHGKLVSILNDEEDKFIMQKISLENHEEDYMWVGARWVDDPPTKSFRWEWITSGEPVRYKNAHWTGAEPTAGRECMMVTGFEDTYKWFPMNCNVNYYFLCEFYLP